MSIDVAAVVNLHREGRRAHPSLISAWRSVKDATAAGIRCEFVIVLDSADEPTTAVADTWVGRGARIVSTDVSDLGAARNLAAQTVDANWIAFLDGDDLWGEHWLRRAHAAANPQNETQPDPMTVWHPQVNVIFGDHHSLLHHVDSEDPSFSWARFRLHNQWTALSFTSRDALRLVPFPPNDLEGGFGYEDWSWNEEILRRGGRHRVVPDTCHFIHRSTRPSLLSRSQRALRTRYPDSAGTNRAVRSTTADATSPPDVSAETHRVFPVDLQDEVWDQIRLAATIEPRVAETLGPNDRRKTLPQNFQTHWTPPHLALDEIERAMSSVLAGATISDLIRSSPALRRLGPADRARVVAEVLLDPDSSDRAWGDSELIVEAIAHFPQLER